jgi:hypothetical protein
MISLEEYFRINKEKGIIDHMLRADSFEDGSVKFYIHPSGKDGITLDYEVKGNELTQIRIPANQPSEWHD